jgi:hypothetical protein
MKNLTFFDWLILLFFNLFIFFITHFWLGMKENDAPIGLFIRRFLFFSIIPILVALFFHFVYRKKSFRKSVTYSVFIICMLTNLIGCLMFYISMTS